MKIYKGFIQGFLSLDHVFVFGSNTIGAHGGGAALTALQLFGAVMGRDRGPQGQAYAIPTCTGDIRQLNLEEIQVDVDRFLEYVRANPKKTFFLTPIGVGIAGFHPVEMAYLFRTGVGLENLVFPEVFAAHLVEPGEQVEVVSAFEGGGT